MTDPSDADDAGLSLIELVIYVLLVSVLLGAMATILINSWSTQQDVQTTTQATNRGQLIGQSIERAVRNSEAVKVSDDKSMLSVHTTFGGERTCQAFWFAGGALYMTNSAGILPAPAPSGGSTPPSAGWPQPWVPSKVVPTGPAGVFDEAGMTVTYSFDIDTDSAPVRFSGEVSRRYAMGDTSPCW